MNDASSVIALVSAARRRQRTVAFVSLAALMVPLGVAIGALTLWLIRPTAPGLGVTLAAATACALVAAGALSVSRAPSLRETAAALDGRLRLEDRLVTSMACLDDPDPVARLVLRDTEARIKDVPLTRVFPLEAPARFAGVLLVAAGAVAVAATRSAENGSWFTNQAGSGIVVGGGRATGAPARGQAAHDQSERATSTGGTSTARSAERAATPPAASERQSSDQAASASSPDRSAAPKIAMSPSSGSGVPAPPPGTSTRRRNDAHAKTSGSAGQREGSSRTATGASTPGGPAGRAQGGSAGASGQTVSAGGVTGGTLTSRPPDDRTLAPLDRATYAARYADAWSRAQAAIGSARVPAAMREYVKRYFSSIHPDQIK
jgi:hypothetical protein